MFNMKNKLLVLFVFFLISLFLIGCSQGINNPTGTEKSEELIITETTSTEAIDCECPFNLECVTGKCLKEGGAYCVEINGGFRIYCENNVLIAREPYECGHSPELIKLDCTSIGKTCSDGACI